MASFLDIFSFWKKEKEDKSVAKADKETVILEDDGSLNIKGLHSFLNFSYDEDFTSYTRQVETYRRIAENADVDEAITEICNDAINFEDDDINPVELSLEETKFSASIRQTIVDEFEYILDLMDFGLDGYEQFRGWYIDGAVGYHKIINPKNKKRGLIGIRKLDTAKFRKIRNVEKDNDTKIIKVEEYFMYDENAGKKKNYKNDFSGDHVVKFPKESIAYVDSGIYDNLKSYPRSNIHKAIRPVNNLISVEVAAVIYRVSRSSEKRIYYVDVGNLQGKNASSYVSNLARSLKSKVTYDADSGSVNSNNAAHAIIEDIFIPRKNGKNTEVDTLPAGQNLGEMDDVEYMQKKLYRSLNVPTSRMNSESLVNIGGIGEIDREELKFSKFIKRLRKRYNILFLDLLQTHLLLKKIITAEEWKENKGKIKLIYNQDLYISEQKEANLLNDRLELAEKATQFVGKYFGHDYIRRNILKQNDQEIMDQDKLMEEEKSDERFQPNEDDENF